MGLWDPEIRGEVSTEALLNLPREKREPALLDSSDMKLIGRTGGNVRVVLLLRRNEKLFRVVVKPEVRMKLQKDTWTKKIATRQSKHPPTKKPKRHLKWVGGNLKHTNVLLNSG
jgi:hypothetical protein